VPASPDSWIPLIPCARRYRSPTTKAGVRQGSAVLLLAVERERPGADCPDDWGWLHPPRRGSVRRARKLASCGARIDRRLRHLAGRSPCSPSLSDGPGAPVASHTRCGECGRDLLRRPLRLRSVTRCRWRWPGADRARSRRVASPSLRRTRLAQTVHALPVRMARLGCPMGGAGDAPTPRRSSTCGISQDARNAMKPIGAAMTNTVWIESA
jgi:hypothetical protein